MIIWTEFSACLHRVLYQVISNVALLYRLHVIGYEGYKDLSFTCQLLSDNQPSRLLSPQCLGFELISCLTWTFDTTALECLCFNHLECCQRIETDSRNTPPNFIWCSCMRWCYSWLKVLQILHLHKCCDPPRRWQCIYFLLAMFCCQRYSYIWTDQCGSLQVLVCQFWEVCQSAYSMHAFTARDKTEMTRQLPFCQHCHGSTGMAVYPKVNGMTSGTESARLRETCACFT